MNIQPVDNTIFKSIIIRANENKHLDDLDSKLIDIVYDNTLTTIHRQDWKNDNGDIIELYSFSNIDPESNQKVLDALKAYNIKFTDTKMERING